MQTTTHGQHVYITPLSPACKSSTQHCISLSMGNSTIRPSVNKWWSKTRRNALSRKKSLDDYFSLRNVRTWQIAFETQQSMAAEITSKTKQTKLKALEKQLPFSSWVSWKRKQQRLTAAQPLKWWACLCFFIYTFMAVYCKIYKAKQFFFRGINHSSRRQKMAKWHKDNTLWYLFIFK